MTGLFSKLNFILRFCCINEKNIWKFCGFMTHQKCVKSMVGETWIELFCTHCHFGKCCDCGELWEKSAYYFHMLQPLPNPKICQKIQLKMVFLSIFNFLWPFQRAISFFFAFVFGFGRVIVDRQINSTTELWRGVRWPLKESRQFIFYFEWWPLKESRKEQIYFLV